MPIPRKIVFWAAALCLPLGLPGAEVTNPQSWIPVRWEGGPLELARRAKAGAVPSDAGVLEAIGKWYDPKTLKLLDGSPVNCLLVAWSAGGEAELERRQRRLILDYAAEAHKRGIAVVGLVYPGSNPLETVADAANARLDGLALDGEFDGRLVESLEKALAAANSAGVVIPITPDAAPLRTAKRPIAAVQGTAPSIRNLADMGIRSGPSAEPWIEFNTWLVKSFRLGPAWRPVWISHPVEGGSPRGYERCVADAAMAGGRWIVSLDDGLRAGLYRNDAGAADTWRRVGALLGFAEAHADWRAFAPFGNLAIILNDPSTAPGAPHDSDMAEEYLKLAARRQAPYRVMLRSQLTAASLAGFRAVLATELAPPTEAERGILKAFAERGGLVIAGPSWGNPPKDEPYAEVRTGKGRVAVYNDPDPESVARDLKDLLSQDDMGVVVFNVPTVIASASVPASGQVLIQLVNYADSPAEAITLRVKGDFKSARMFTPEAAPVDLVLKSSGGKSDVTIPKLLLWGAVIVK